MDVRIPKNKNFEYKKCENLYNKNQKSVNDDAEFKDIVSHTFFYSFYNNNTLVGCIYLYYKNSLLFLNGFSQRKYYSFNLSAIKQILKWFTCDIYAESIQKPAILVLLRCGFKKIKQNLYVHTNG